MVRGLDKFRDAFADYADEYTLIGGAACEMVLDEAGIAFRGTKDLDIVLSVEALSEPFVQAFWDFVQAGQYEHQYKGTDKKQFYRFEKPADDEFPYMLELFSRQPDALALADESHLTPIPTDDAISSLSAILLSDDYYDFVQGGRRMLNGIPIVGAEHLIPLKAKAWCELTQRKAEGQQVDSKDIRKHRNDVFRLYVILDPEFDADLRGQVREDLDEFFVRVANEDVSLKQLGVQGVTPAEVLTELRRIYGLDQRSTRSFAAEYGHVQLERAGCAVVHPLAGW